jgi:PAS domain S-box-containing protein
VTTHRDDTAQPARPDDSRDRRFLRAVIDAIPHFIFARDAEGRFTLVNKAVADFYGRRVDEIEGRHLSEIHSDAEQALQWLQEDRRTLELGREWSIPGTLTSGADGQDIWISAIKKPLAADLVGVEQVLGVSIDLTEQMRAERALARRLDYEHTAAALFQTFVHCTRTEFDRVMTRVMARLGRFSRAERTFLYRFDDQGGCAELAYDWRREDKERDLPLCLAPDSLEWLMGLFEMKVPVMTADLSAHATIPAPFLDAWGRDSAGFVAAPILHGRKLYGFVGMDTSDARDWPQEEINLLHTVADLFITVWSKHEVERSLVSAMREARASDRAKSEFLANMSHEIRTPMNSVIGLADLLGDMQPTPRQRQYLDMIRTSGAALLTLINDVLDLSKIEAGQLELDLVPVDLRELLQEITGLIAFNAQSRGLEVVCRLAPGVPPQVLLDPSRLRQVLTNLLNNAAKFTPRGHVYLNVEPVGGDDEHMELRFAVADTGIGIAPENLERIFEKFTQAEAGTTRRFGGTGLGLSISRHLVGLMGGRIFVASQPGQGAEFSFTIPVKMLSCDLTPAVADPANLLIVTGHELTGEVLAEQARALGHQARVMVGGVEALDEAAGWASAADRAYTHLVVNQDPAQDSVPDLTPYLERLAPKHTPHVILLSNLPSLLQDHELRAKGYDGALTKPVHERALFGLLCGDSALNLQAAPRPSAAPAPAPAATDEPERELVAEPADGPRVLLAEDNPFNQKVALAMLRLLGCRVEVATNGAEALDLVAREPFDLVLMDCQMPVMDGYHATRRIRALPGDAAAVTIIAMTANALSGDRAACFAAGMDDFLSKPITKAMLSSMLEKWEITSPQEPAEPEPEPAPR